MYVCVEEKEEGGMEVSASDLTNITKTTYLQLYQQFRCGDVIRLW